MDIILTAEEYFIGALVGVRRRVRAIKTGVDRRNRDPDPSGRQRNWVDEIQGTLCEFAFCKELHLPFDFSEARGEPDTAYCEIRSGEFQSAHLMCRAWEKENCLERDAEFVLIIHEPNTFDFRIAGYMLSSDIFKSKYWKEFRGRNGTFWAYAVPQSDLSSASQQAVCPTSR